VGGFLIAVFLIAGALLPRPNAEYRVLDEWLAGALGPRERQASDFDQIGDNPGKDAGRPGRDKDAANDKKGSGRKRDGKAKDRAAEKDGKGQDKDGKDGSSRGDPGKDRAKDGGAKDKGEKGNKANRDGGGKKQDGNKGSGKGDSQPASPPSHPDTSSLPEITRPIANVLKWVVGILAALVVLFLLCRSGLRFLANFTHWARRLLEAFRAFWQALCDWWNGASASAEEEEEDTEAAPPRPFAAFHDPFASGAAAGMSARQLVRYSFEALQAWAAERGLGRQVGETPLEFAERVSEEVPALEAGVRPLADLYAQIAYARGSLTAACREPLRQLWQLLTEAVERPMSAGVGRD
jgi:hypothetical protein